MQRQDWTTMIEYRCDICHTIITEDNQYVMRIIDNLTKRVVIKDKLMCGQCKENIKAEVEKYA